MSRYIICGIWGCHRSTDDVGDEWVQWTRRDGWWYCPAHSTTDPTTDRDDEDGDRP